jgi:hypothetical protein
MITGKLLGKCLESPETFVEIPQKLEVSNRTMPVTIVMTSDGIKFVRAAN